MNLYSIYWLFDNWASSPYIKLVQMNMAQCNVVVVIVEKYHPGLYLIWDIDAIQHLRSKHSRIGNFMNMCISKSRHSLPLQITAQELLYLRAQSCCTVHVVDKSLLSNVAFENAIQEQLQTNASEISRCQKQLIRDYSNLVKKITAGDFGQRSQLMTVTPVEKSTPVPGDVLSVLKEQFFTTGGLKFGCHLLLYPGNPLCYHASHMFLYFRPDDLVMVKNLLTLCRLGTHVNKAVVLATKKANGTQIYITFNHVKIGKSGKSNFFFKKI
ncbi:tRNA-splicing endonuclease subunit [Trichinella pseudospiralis]